MRTELLHRIDEAVRQTISLSIKRPDPLLGSFLAELSRYREMVSDHWPLTEQEKSGVDIGPVAVRELNDTVPDYVMMLCRLAADLRKAG